MSTASYGWRRRVGSPALVAAVACGLLPGPATAEAVREPALAGQWYPGGHAHLVSGAHFLMRLAASAPSVDSPPVALVVPHAGWNFSGLVAATAYRLLRPGTYDRVVVVAPSHRESFTGYALADVAAWRTPLGEIPVCAGTTEALTGDEARPRPGTGTHEHSIEVELPFLQVSIGAFCLVPVLAGETTPEVERAFAGRLAGLDDGRTLFVFSSDFVHYGPRYEFAPYGALSPATLEWIRRLDDRAIARLEAVDASGFRSLVEETRATICGRNALSTLLELLPRIAPGARANLLAHQLSADLPAVQDDASVSYVALAFTRGGGEHPPAANGERSLPTPLTSVPDLPTVPENAPPLAKEAGDRLVRLARATLRSELGGTADLDEELASWPSGPGELRRQGVFVSLYEGRPGEGEGAPGTLRGCVGQALPVLPLFYGTVQAALDAALHDERFDPVTAAELDRLEVEVTVLSPRRPVESWKEIRLGRDGIVLEKGDKGALLLPQVAAQMGSLEQVLSALAVKAKLPEDGWKSGARFSVFTGQVFAEGR